ncbi:MAG: flagellar basal body-associated FliL family protein [Myxococcota bacterium]
MAATDTEITGDPVSAKASSKKPMLLGLIFALLLGAVGFFASYTGLLPFTGEPPAAEEETPASSAGAEIYSFVPLEPMVVSLGSPGAVRHLQFRAEVEVTPGREDEVLMVMPRLMNTLNGYLRAIPIEELEEPSALIILRAQMLRRMQLLGPENAIRDLLIIEFVLD